MRREIGGGATYLDENQVFYQLIWKKNNPSFPKAVDEIYPWFSQAPVQTYKAFGIEAEFQVVNDILTRSGKKIAGEGGGNIGECMVFVGGILLDFDYQAMSKILKVPNEKFRDKVFRTMEENLTTMKRELGTHPPREEVVKILKEQFEKLIGKLQPASLNSEVLKKMKEIEVWMTSEAFLLKETPRIPKGVKIRQGVEVLYGLHEAKGGLIRTAEEIWERKIEEIALSGDLTFYPKEGLDGLEQSLGKAPLEEEKIIEQVKAYSDEKKVESPGVELKDIAQTILNPVKGTE